MKYIFCVFLIVAFFSGCTVPRPAPVESRAVKPQEKPTGFFSNSDRRKEEKNGHYIVKEGDTLFKMNCVRCHGITARGLIGPDLHSITLRLNDIEIIKQVIEGDTPPMPSFEIDPQNMSNLLTYLHSLQ